MDVRISSRTYPAWLYRIAFAGLFLAGIFLRAAPLDANRFHEDEALYAYLGLQIATGADPMLETYPVDKPPGFPYLLALVFLLLGPSEWAARLPALLASAAGLLLAAGMARRLYGRGAALATLAILAFNPFDISFAVTALTDPLLVACVLGALACLLAGRPGWAGVCAGVAFGVKQQALFFLPLLLAVGVWYHAAEPRAEKDEQEAKGFIPLLSRAWGRWPARLGIGFVLAYAPALVWDLARTRRPGYFAQSLISYGGLGLARWDELGERAVEWSALAGQFWGTPAATFIAALALCGLLLFDVHLWRRWRDRTALLDLILFAFIAAFLIVHWLLRFNVWDRYLLGLLPLLAILLGRAWAVAWERMSGVGRPALGALTLLVGLGLLLPPALTAAQGAYPVGGDHGAYWGIDEVADYLETNMPANAVLHHRWLGWHYLYYLYGKDYALQWYTQPAQVVQRVQEWPDVPHWIVFPSCREWEPVKGVLEGAGIVLVLRHEVRRPDGVVTFRIFELLPAGQSPIRRDAEEAVP